MSTTESRGLSEFEKQRLENIAKRDELLRSLNLGAHSTGFFSGPKPPKPSTPKQKRTTPKREKPEIPLVRRQSRRLKGEVAEGDTEGTKRAAEDDLARGAEQPSKARKTDDLDHNAMFVAGQKLSTVGLIGGDMVTKAVAEPYVRTFGDEDIMKTTDKDLKAVREEMNGLKLWDQWDHQRIKVTPERIYTMTFHPTEYKPLLFAGDKIGHLGILDASQERLGSNDDDEDEDEPDLSITTLKPHTRTLVSMLIHPSKPTHLYTASYDGSIRELDLEKTVSVEKYASSDDANGDGFSDVDMAANDPNSLYWTTLNGEFGRYDTRVIKSDESVSLWQLSEKKIGGFSLCPGNPNYFATASLDRTLRLWDLRKLPKDEPEPVAIHTSRLSVSHAAFNAVGQIATSSYDDTIKIYDVGTDGMASWEQAHESAKEFQPDHVVRHNCQTGRWVTILRPRWQLNPQSKIQRFCIANMNRFVDVYSGSGDQLAQLGGDSITAVPSAAAFHRSKNWVAGGTASGKVCLWM